VAHFLAGFEIRNALGLHVHRLPGAGIATDATITRTRGEGAEATQLDAATFCKALGNSVKNARYDLLDLALGEAWLIFVHESDEFGPDH
jgi:hypothetical protein